MKIVTFKIITFAWVRTQTGEPEFDYHSSAQTVGELLAELIATRSTWASLADREAAIQCAVDQTMVSRDAGLEGVGEVAFFPPVTGG